MSLGLAIAPRSFISLTMLDEVAKVASAAGVPLLPFFFYFVLFETYVC
jgi:hypothetical protein